VLSVYLGAVLLTLLLFSSVHAVTFSGGVVGPLDGDTVEMLDGGRSLHRIRTAQIDISEKAQAFGTRAKQKLLDLVGGQQFTVHRDKVDKYGRTAGKQVISDGQHVNLEMVAPGPRLEVLPIREGADGGGSGSLRSRENLGQGQTTRTPGRSQPDASMGVPTSTGQGSGPKSAVTRGNAKRFEGFRAG